MIIEIVKSILIIVLSILGFIQLKENIKLSEEYSELNRELYITKIDENEKIYKERMKYTKKLIDAEGKEEKYKKIIKEILYSNERSTENEEIRIVSIPKEEEKNLKIEITDVTDNIRILKLVNDTEII